MKKKTLYALGAGGIALYLLRNRSGSTLGAVSKGNFLMPAANPGFTEYHVSDIPHFDNLPVDMKAPALPSLSNLGTGARLALAVGGAALLLMVAPKLMRG